MTEKPLQPEQLRIIVWPDPRLRKVSAPVREFNPWLRQVTQRMFELMREARGVGLAAPQVGLNIRLFVLNPTGEAPDDKVYVNPILSEAEDEEDGEEGCLSLPGININVMRSKKLRMQAQDLDGNSFEQIESGYVARIWQHENDHLNGTLLLDRMGPVAKMTHRKKIKELEADWVEIHGKLPKK
jgi:peptide deformylase